MQKAFENAPTEGTPVAPDPEVVRTMEDESNGSSAIALRDTVALGQVAGDFSSGDLKIPRLQIAYGVGNLAEKFQPGDLILQGDNLLVKKGEPLNVVVLSVQGYWKEYVTPEMREASARARIFATEAEVLKAGGTTQWVDGVGPSFSKAMDLRLLIQKPEGIVCGLFGIKVEGKDYAPAVWSIDKSAYRRVAPVVLSSATFALKARGLLSGMFEVRTGIEKINGNNTIVPSIKLVGHNSEQFLTELKKAFEG